MIEVQCDINLYVTNFQNIHELEIVCALVDQLSLTVKVTNPFGVEVEA